MFWSSDCNAICARVFLKKQMALNLKKSYLLLIGDIQNGS